MASKTCMYFLQGNCKFGRRCRNSHDLEVHRLSGNADNLGAHHHLQGYVGSVSTNQPSGPEILIEESNASRIKQLNKTENIVENNEIKPSAEMKEENKSVKVNAKELPELEKNQASSETYNADFTNAVRCAIDSDFQCNICFEIFIKPMVLNCSHTFCETCILRWTKESLKCPVCRELITSKSHCLALNSVIEKIIEKFSMENKLKRQEEITNRSKIDTVITSNEGLERRVAFPPFLSWDELVEFETSSRSNIFNNPYERYGFNINLSNSLRTDYIWWTQED